MGPDGAPTGHIICYPSFSPNCTVVTNGFTSLSAPTRFHDEVLTKATQEINEILMKVVRESKQDFRKSNLHLVLTDDGPILVWVGSMAMRVDDIRKVSGMMA
jgi:hypothetical protein